MELSDYGAVETAAFINRHTALPMKITPGGHPDGWHVEVRKDARDAEPRLTVVWFFGGRFRLSDGREIDGAAELAAHVRAPADEKGTLIRHLRAEHPNLLGAGPDVRIGRTPLPTSLARVPLATLNAVHDAAHLGLWSQHEGDDWLCRDLVALRAADAVTGPAGPEVIV